MASFCPLKLLQSTPNEHKSASQIPVIFDADFVLRTDDKMFSILSIVLFIMAVYLMNKRFIGFQPSSKRVNSDVGRFRQQAEAWKQELIPWNEEELELFSLNQSNQVKKKGFGRSQEGIVQSIYHEPMLFYSFKEYPSAGKNGIIFVQTAKYEIVYRTRAKGIQIFVNEEFLGSLTKDWQLQGQQGPLGRLDRSDPFRKLIIVGDKIMGSVVLPMEQTSVSQRAFELDEKMNEEEQLIFMVLGIYEVLEYLTG